MAISVGVSFLAGLLAILSPCVLPLVPIILASAFQQHRFGPVALVLGLSITFTVFGLLLAATGSVLGLDEEVFRLSLLILMLFIGILLVSTYLQEGLVRLANPLSQGLDSFYHRFHLTGARGQFALGLLLGGIWLPCTGPTLGLATTFASQGKNLGQSVLIMVFYSIGAGLPLLAIAYGTRGLVKKKKHWMEIGKTAKMILGSALILVSGLQLTKLDKTVEAFLLTISPQWLVDFSTRF